jgi:hypothetical protein
VNYLPWIGLVLLGIYEFWALASESKDPAHQGLTISEHIWNVTLKHPLVPFAFGMLMGHFFWQASH